MFRKMNFVAFGFILICCHVWAIEKNDNFIEFKVRKTKLENFLERYKSSLRDGTSKLKISGIPISDPFNASTMSIKFNTNTTLGNIDIDANFTSVNMNGLSQYTVNNANFKLIGLKMHADLNWPLVIANANYSLDAVVFENYEVYGDGEMNVAVHDFRIIVDIDFILKGQHVQIKKTKTKLSLRALDFHATGLYNDEDTSEMLSKTISNAVPEIISTNQDLIANVNLFITQFGNDFLRTMTLKDILKMLQ